MSIVKSLHRPKELSALLKLKFQKHSFADLSSIKKTGRPEEVNYCFETLDKVSRSFAAVIKQLPAELDTAVCIFYLTLRALDSIEDDMDCPKQEKLQLLEDFHKVNYLENWSIKGVGDKKEYRELLENYDKVTRAFSGIHPKYQEIITDICQKMGCGMATFIEKEILTKEDYDLYCHHVAGLVGIGLSQLFSVSGYEEESLGLERELSNSMGLFLQKTNIVRDYFEDIPQKRFFWPREVWEKHGHSLEEFASSPNGDNALSCLNELVCDALAHVPDCLDYLGKIKNPHVFRFCAIPQVMAIATLAKVYNNPQVFLKAVKIRKGLTAQFILTSNTFLEVLVIFKEMIEEFEQKVPKYSIDSKEATQLLKQVKIHIDSLFNNRALEAC